MSRKKVLKEEILKRLGKVYSFSSSDNFIKETTIDPKEFLLTTYDEAKLNYQKRNRIFNLSFEDYLLNDITYKNVKGIKRVLRGTKKSKYRIPIPFLEFDEKGNPIGHEGRHTMIALKELGIKDAPVTISKRKEAFRRW